jgi:hypothetical protein
MVLVLLEQKCAFKLLGFPDEDELTVQLEAYLNLYLSHLVILYTVCVQGSLQFLRKGFLLFILLVNIVLWCMLTCISDPYKKTDIWLKTIQGTLKVNLVSIDLNRDFR